MSNFSVISAKTKLSKAAIITETHSQRVEISSVIKARKDGTMFKWENPIDPANPYYAIVNLNCFTEYKFKVAQELIKEGRIVEATNETMSFNLPLDQVSKFESSSYVNAEFVWRKNKDGIDILVVSKLFPIEIKAAPKASFVFDDEKSPTETIGSSVEEKEFA